MSLPIPHVRPFGPSDSILSFICGYLSLEHHNITQGSIRLKRLANLIERKGKDFEKNWDSIAAEISFVSWFKSQNWPKTVTFAGAIAGFLSLILIILMFVHNHYKKGLIRSIMFASIPTVT